MMFLYLRAWTLILVGLVCGLAWGPPCSKATAQEPSRAREDLVRSLEDRLVKSCPISAELRIESADAGGTKKLRTSAFFHLRLEEGRLYVALRDMDPEATAPQSFVLVENTHKTLVWVPGGEGDLRDVSNFNRRLLRHEYELKSEMDSILEKPQIHKDAGVFLSRLRSMICMDLIPSPTGGPHGEFKFSFGLSETSRATWLDEALKASEAAVKEGMGEITVRLAKPQKTIVIDRTTGLLRSMQLDLPGGESRVLTVDKITPQAELPDVRIPGRIVANLIPSDRFPSQTAEAMRGSLPQLCGTLLAQLDAAGIKEKAEAIRAFVASLAARHETLIREGAHRNLGARLLQHVRERGKSLDDVTRDLKAAGDALREEIERVENRDAGRLLEVRADFQEAFRKAARESIGAKEAVKALVDRIDEAFESGRFEKAREKFRPLDAETVLREAIEDVLKELMSVGRFEASHRADQVKRLENEITKIKSSFLRMVLENPNIEGAGKTLQEADIHLQLEKGYVYAEFHNVEAGKRTLNYRALYHSDGRVLVLVPGESGQCGDDGPSVRWTQRSFWEWECEVDRLSDRPPRYRTIDEYVSALKPFYSIRVQPASSEPARSIIQLGAERRLAGGASWLDELRSASRVEYPDGPEGHTILTRGTHLSTSIDMKTGLLRSVRYDLPGGGTRVWTVADVRSATPEPEIVRPAKVESHTLPAERAASYVQDCILDDLERELGIVLRRWEYFGRPERAEALRRFFTVTVLRQESCLWAKLRVRASVQEVRDARKMGRSFEELTSKLDDNTLLFAAKLATFERERPDQFSDQTAKLKSDIANIISRLPGPYEDRRALETLANQGIHPDRVRAARPARAPVDCKTLLQAAIDSEREKEGK